MLFRSPQEMARTIALRDGEHDDDMMSVYDAMNRYCVSRTALRNAALKNKIPYQWVGGQSKQIMLMRRSDIRRYISKPVGKNEHSRPVAWRLNHKDALRPADINPDEIA